MFYLTIHYNLRGTIMSSLIIKKMKLEKKIILIPKEKVITRKNKLPTHFKREAIKRVKIICSSHQSHE
jgi:hypothetical protein